MIRPLAPLLVAAALAALAFADDPADRPAEAGSMPLAYRSDFDAGGLEGWTFTDRAAWRLAEVDGSKVLDQHKNSAYEPEVRSPLNIALMPGVEVGDFVLDLEVRSTGRDYGHRDLCLFFGHVDPAHFYYVHLGKEADPHAHSIFLVNGEPRVSIAARRTEGTPWTDGWHRVRVVRRLEDGLIAVYFDDMAAPIMTANDRTFGRGRVGVGSFDDTGQFRKIRLRGEPAP